MGHLMMVMDRHGCAGPGLPSVRNCGSTEMSTQPATPPDLVQSKLFQLFRTLSRSSGMALDGS
jgi:hypothetical protein